MRKEFKVDLVKRFTISALPNLRLGAGGFTIKNTPGFAEPENGPTTPTF